MIGIDTKVIHCLYFLFFSNYGVGKDEIISSINPCLSSHSYDIISADIENEKSIVADYPGCLEEQSCLYQEKQNMKREEIY